jgi:hypothetical protein
LAIGSQARLEGWRAYDHPRQLRGQNQFIAATLLLVINSSLTVHAFDRFIGIKKTTELAFPLTRKITGANRELAVPDVSK